VGQPHKTIAGRTCCCSVVLNEWCTQIWFASASSWYLTSHPGQLSLAIPSMRRCNEYLQKLGSNQAVWYTVQYSWPRSVRWCLADGYRSRGQHHPMGPLALEGLYFFIITWQNQKKTTLIVNVISKYHQHDAGAAITKSTCALFSTLISGHNNAKIIDIDEDLQSNLIYLLL